MAIKLTGNQQDQVWLSKAIGEPFPIRDDVAGTPIPPTTSALYRFIKLTHNDGYNAGALINQTLNNADPVRPISTAQIDYPSSPIHGRTLNLINTERRFVRAGESGALQDDDFKSHSHPHGLSNTTQAGSNTAGVGGGSATATALTGGLETRGRNQGATFYMRIF